MIKKNTFDTKGMVLCAMFTALIAVGAFIKIPVPMMPFTLQFLFTNMAALLLGRKLGSMAVGIYIALGLAGLPIFTSGGGIGYILQPTFGYILGFLAGAWAAGHVIEKRKNHSLKTLMIAGFVNLAVVYLLGMIYYYVITRFYLSNPIGIWTLVLYCFILAVPGDIALCISASVLTKRLLPVITLDRREYDL